MLRYTVRRLLAMVPVLFGTALVTFALMHQAPGGPFDQEGARRQLDARTREALERRFGLDKPEYFNPAAAAAAWAAGERSPIALGAAALDSQFFSYVGNALQGDLGPSYRQRGKSVQDILAAQWPYSLRLGGLALAIAVAAGVPLGVLAALRQNTAFDYLSLLVATAGAALPTFITGLLVIIVFGGQLGWISITRSDWDTWPPYLAPALVLSFGSMAYLTRLTRAAVLEVRRQDYVRTARAKGLADSLVVRRHILRNALIPVVTVLGPALVEVITGAVITETLFGIPGVGGYFVSAIFQRDYSMIMGTTLVYAVAIALANLVVDLSYGLIDPRIGEAG